MIYEFPGISPSFSNKINGEYEVIQNGNPIDNGKVSLAPEKESGAYKWILPKKIKSSESQISIKLVDDENYEWRLKYYPSITVQMPPSPIPKHEKFKK